MFQYKLIQHSDLSQNELEEIIQVKSVVWPYQFEKQIEWINLNLKDSDYHLLLFDEARAVAYLNLIDIELMIDNFTHKALGVGNVCSIEKWKGYGSKLMTQVNSQIINYNLPGLLFCKQRLVSFYEKSEWRIIAKSSLELIFDNKEVETMIFNSGKPFSKLTYSGSAF